MSLLLLVVARAGSFCLRACACNGVLLEPRQSLQLCISNYMVHLPLLSFLSVDKASSRNVLAFWSRVTCFCGVCTGWDGTLFTPLFDSTLLCPPPPSSCYFGGPGWARHPCPTPLYSNLIHGCFVRKHRKTRIFCSIGITPRRSSRWTLTSRIPSRFVSARNSQPLPQPSCPIKLQSQRP